MARPANTTAIFYKEDEETRRMMGSMGLGLGLGMGMGLEEEAGTVEQVKEDPDSTGGMQMLNETQFIFEFPGQEEENSHNTTVEHETRGPSSEYLHSISHSSSLSFHSDLATLQLGSYNSNNLGDINTPASTSIFHDHSHLSSTSSVPPAALSGSAYLPPLRPGSPTTEAMRSMMSVFRVDPFASYDVDAGSRRKRRKRGSSYAMLSDPEQTSREEPLMFTFQVEGIQDNEYVNFNHLNSTSVMLDGSLSTPSSPSINLLSSYSSNLADYNTFLHSESDDLSSMVLHSAEETTTTTMVTTAGGDLYTSYTPSSRHHPTFHNINMMGNTMQRHSHPHHNLSSSSHLSSNPVASGQSSTQNLSNTSYMLQQNAFNLNLGLDMNMNTTGLDTSFHGSVLGTNTRVPIPGVNPLPMASVPMILGLSDADANVGSSTSNLDSLSTPITEFSGMVGHHLAEEGQSSVWPSPHSHSSYSHSSHHHSPAQPRYQRRHHHQQSRHTHTPQSQNRGFGSHFIDGEEEQLRYPLDIHLNKPSGIRGLARLTPMPEQEHEPEHKYQAEPENQSQIGHTRGPDDENQNRDDNRGNAHEGDGLELQEIQDDQIQIVEYDLSPGNVRVEDVREIVHPDLESRNLDLNLPVMTGVGQLTYPPSSPGDDEESENKIEKGEEDRYQNIYKNAGEKKDGGIASSNHMLKFGAEFGSSLTTRSETQFETKKRPRGNDNLENNPSLKVRALNHGWYSPRPADEDGAVEAQRGVPDRDYAIISPSLPLTHSPTSFPSSSEFDTGLNDDCDHGQYLQTRHEYLSKHHEGNEKVDMIDLEIPAPEILVTSRPAWTGPGGTLLLSAPSAAGPEYGHGHNNKEGNSGQNEGGLGFGSCNVGSSSLGLELESNFELGSGPGMEVCSSSYPGPLLAQGDQCLNGDATPNFTSSPSKSSSAVSLDSPAESPNALSAHHQIQLPKLHSHNQFQGSTHNPNHYFNNSDDHSAVVGQVYTSQSSAFSLPPSSLNIVSSEPSLSLDVIYPSTNMNTNSSLPPACGLSSGTLKMHLCWICHKEFPRPSGLATHMNTHSGLKPYRCPIPACSKTFAVRSNARRHLRIHGTESGPSGVYCNTNEGSGGSPTSFPPPYNFNHGRERSPSPLNRSLKHQGHRRKEAYSCHYPYAPPESYLSRQDPYQYAAPEGRPPPPSPNHEGLTRTVESGGLSNFYDYYIEEYRHGAEQIEELESDSMPSISGIKHPSASTTPNCITAIPPELLFLQHDCITSTPQAMSDTRPSSTSSTSTMHTPISSTLEDPNVSSSNDLHHKETHVSQFTPRSVEMRIGMDAGPPTSIPTEALVSMPIPQAPKFGSSMLLYF